MKFTTFYKIFISGLFIVGLNSALIVYIKYPTTWNKFNYIWINFLLACLIYYSLDSINKEVKR